MASRILNVPVRATIQERDSITGSYPTIARTGDETRTGKALSCFNDRDTVVFDEAIINLPYGLHQSGIQLERQNTVNVLPVQGEVIPGVGDNFALISLPHPTESLGPFVEFNRPEYGTSDFYMTGTSESVIPGFKSPLKSKTIIRINMSSSGDFIIVRSFADRNDSADPDGEFLGINKAGFAYFDFSERNWQDIGLFDPATGIELAGQKGVAPDWAVDPLAIVPTLTLKSGTSHWCQQFTAPDQIPAITDELRVTDTNLKHVGYPTVTIQAPFANRYHATSSQALELSEYISHPFLLEKAVLSFDKIGARRIQNWKAADQTAERYLDEYVFFMYRQENTNNPEDSAQDVSGSQRYLICSASMCFYNSLIKKPNSIDPHPDEFRPIHGPQFSYDYELPQTPAEQTGFWLDRVKLEMVPTTAGACLTGRTNITGSNSVLGFLETNAWIDNYWPGGTSSRSFLPRIFTGRDQDAFSLDGFVDFGPDTYNCLHTASLNRTMQCMDLVKPDHRAHAFLGRGGWEATGSQSGQRALSPYLLLPTDKIVIGVDSLIGMCNKQLANELTGSLLKIYAGNASLTLYGSLIRNNIEFHDTLNQPLTSEAIHEDLHFDNPTVDQYNIEPSSTYSGSYSQRIISGSIFDTNPITARQVYSNAAFTSAMFPSTTSGSVSRTVSCATSNEIYYDTITPSLSSYIISAGGTPTDTVDGGSGPIPENCYDLGPWDSLDGYPTLIFRDPRFVESNDFAKFSMPSPFVENPVRINDDATVLYTYFSSGPLTEGQYVRGKMLRRLLFVRGQREIAEGVATDKFYHMVTGSMSFRYGLKGVDPTASSVKFRYDKYGQFRDMLEQRDFTVFFNDLSERIKIRGSRQKLGTKVGPVSIRFVSGSTAISPNDAVYSGNLSVAATSSIPYADVF